MTPQQFELLYTISNDDFNFEDRIDAAYEINKELWKNNIEAVDIQLFYKAMVEFWRSLGKNKKDREDNGLFAIRKKMANICYRLSLRLLNGQKFFNYYPKVNKSEGFDNRTNKIKEGILKTGYGTSLYEFHWEYPIEGFGVRKDLISVITDKNERIPMLKWCKQNDIIVFCNRCGLEITQEVSKDCPFRNRR